MERHGCATPRRARRGELTSLLSLRALAAQVSADSLGIFKAPGAYWQFPNSCPPHQPGHWPIHFLECSLPGDLPFLSIFVNPVGGEIAPALYFNLIITRVDLPARCLLERSYGWEGHPVVSMGWGCPSHHPRKPWDSRGPGPQSFTTQESHVKYHQNGAPTSRQLRQKGSGCPGREGSEPQRGQALGLLWSMARSSKTPTWPDPSAN